MIKFEFTVSEIDAENIMSCIRRTAIRNDEHIIEYMCRNDLTEELLIWKLQKKMSSL